MANIALVTVVVGDYDEAINYYVGVLGFQLVQDAPVDKGKRWVVVAPPGGRGASLLLARASTEAQQARIGDQTGGRVFLFLDTDNFVADYARMKAAGVTFTEQPRHEDYGTVAVFVDLYGNRWDLIQRKRHSVAADT